MALFHFLSVRKWSHKIAKLNSSSIIVFFPVGHRDHVVGGRRVVGRNQETRKGRQGTDPRSASGTPARTRPPTHRSGYRPAADHDTEALLVVRLLGHAPRRIGRGIGRQRTTRRGAFPTQSSRCGKAGDDGPPAHAMFKRLHSH